MSDLSFYKGKKVFITGHTGFKGSWLCRILINAGAIVTGYALEPEKDSLFNQVDIERNINHIVGDVRNIETLKKALEKAQPEIVIHMAAQPLVKKSYEEPVYTYETNVMGTVNVLECIRNCKSVKSFLNVTTDKVYKNNEWEWGYRENEYLNGFDPYSNSKSCSELVTDCYRNSFFDNREIGISTVRAGNVIGGGDFSKDRIIPDCIRASEKKETILLRNPNAIRPFQHVLEALFAYLMIAEKQYGNKKYNGAYNVGPNEEDCVSTGELADMFCKYWGDNQQWTSTIQEGPHEANFLRLDNSKIKSTFSWNPTWNLEDAIEKTIDFTKATNKIDCMDNQIDIFSKLGPSI